MLEGTGAINLFELINQCLESYKFVRKDLLYIGLAKRDGLYIANKVIPKVVYIVSVLVLQLTHLFF